MTKTIPISTLELSNQDRINVMPALVKN